MFFFGGGSHDINEDSRRYIGIMEEKLEARFRASKNCRYLFGGPHNEDFIEDCWGTPLWTNYLLGTDLLNPHLS